MDVPTAAADGVPAVHVPGFRTVLCAVDASEHSRAALYLAAGLSAEPGCRLIVLRADDRATGNEKERQKAQFELQAFVRSALPGQASYRDTVSQVLVEGDPAAAIVQTATSCGADLVVVGSRGRSAMRSALFGSTTGTLLRETRVPLAIVPPAHPEVVTISAAGAASHLGIVVVPIDLEEPAQRQMEFAAALSPGSEHRLLLMAVVPPGMDHEGPRQKLRVLAGSVTTARGCRVLVKDGTVAETVLSVLHHESVGVVVLGKSSGAPGKLAAELVRQAGSVVVVVP